MADVLNVTVENGKYTVIQRADGSTTALRYGEPWPAFEGRSLDNLHTALAWEVAELREQLAYWQRGTDLINKCLVEAAKADPQDAPIPLVGIEAKRWHAYRAEAFRHALEMMGVPEAAPVKKRVSAEAGAND